jgi:proteasome lid subunit RPN8/RPN11
VVAETSFVVRIPEPIYKEMVAHVSAGYPNETCGALGSQDDLVVKHYPTANVAEHPDDFSEIGSDDLLRIDKDMRTYQGEMIYYHSHPKTEAYPSSRDIDYARHNGYLYVIFSHQYYPEPPYARVFKIALDDGAVTEGKITVF